MSQEREQTPEEVLGGASFDICKCAVIVFKKNKILSLGGSRHILKTNPIPAQLRFSYAKSDGVQPIVWGPSENEMMVLGGHGHREVRLGPHAPL